MSVTRKTQEMGVIYVTPGAENGEPESVFFTPDGLGRIWFDTVEEAHRETGIAKVIHLMSEPDDN
jgi:hypothetical protein